MINYRPVPAFSMNLAFFYQANIVFLMVILERALIRHFRDCFIVNYRVTGLTSGNYTIL